LYLHPDFVLAHFALGSLARRQGSAQEASKHFANTLDLLQRYHQDEVLPESDGWTAGQLIEMVGSSLLLEKL
jgi:chemotaxis protein methyltransferase CheR